MIPHTAPPVWPDIRPGRFAASIVQNSTELLDAPDAEALLAKCRVALLGLPDDTGVELNRGRPGAKHGPHALRAALAGYGVAHPMDHGAATPPYPHVFDAGDVTLGQTLEQTHERVSAAARAIVERGMLPIGIGGGHDLTFAFVRGVAAGLGSPDGRGGSGGPDLRAGSSASLSGVYFDAHLDVRAEPGSGMPFRALIEHGIARGLCCVGVNPLVNTREHGEWFTQHGGVIHAAPERPPGDTGAGGLWPMSTPHFVSFDLDVIDAGSAPGVSAMNPAGMAPGVAAAWCRAAGAQRGCVCFDIMELCPPHDDRGRTARLAAHLLLSFLRGFAQR